MQARDRPLIVEVKRGSHEDGPGIRSVVFFKGCPLRCVFCHSPETQNAQAEVVFSRRRCVDCGRCLHHCPQGAIDLDRPGRVDRAKCTGCGRCAEACLDRALRRVGRYYPVDELIEILLRDLPFYRHSKGGVTLSGGECTLYPDYVESLLAPIRAVPIHVALQTCGFFDYDVFARRILPYVDLIYFDVKLADPQDHRRFTGRSNARILANLRRLLHQDEVTVHPRIPLVPGITATRENLSAIVDVLREIGAPSVSLLPYNPLGVEMAVNLGRPRPPVPETFMKPAEQENLYGMFEEITAASR